MTICRHGGITSKCPQCSEDERLGEKASSGLSDLLCGEQEVKMISAYERAAEFFRNSGLEYTENDVVALKDTLREQDDETRLRCAEAAWEESGCNEVYEACMKTQAA